MAINLSDENQNYVRALSFAMTLWRFTGVVNTVKNSFANYAVDNNLERIGRDRNLPRYQGEEIVDFRARVLEAFERNQGLGSVDDIISTMEGLGARTLGVQYQFNSFIQGDKGDSSEGLFNLLIKSLAGGATYGGTYKYDGTLKYDAPSASDIIIEIIQTPAISTDQENEIRNNLLQIIRASSKVQKIIRIAP